LVRRDLKLNHRVSLHAIEGETWVVAAERMKERKEHCVPLTKDVLALTAGRKGKLFPGHERQMLDRLNQLRPGYTVHRFRSSFVDWAAEHDYPQGYARWHSPTRWAIRLSGRIGQYAPQQKA
jgi:integrase